MNQLYCTGRQKICNIHFEIDQQWMSKSWIIVIDQQIYWYFLVWVSVKGFFVDFVPLWYQHTIIPHLHQQHKTLPGIKKNVCWGKLSPRRVTVTFGNSTACPACDTTTIILWRKHIVLKRIWVREYGVSAVSSYGGIIRTALEGVFELLVTFSWCVDLLDLCKHKIAKDSLWWWLNAMRNVWNIVDVVFKVKLR